MKKINIFRLIFSFVLLLCTPILLAVTVKASVAEAHSYVPQIVIEETYPVVEEKDIEFHTSMFEAPICEGEEKKVKASGEKLSITVAVNGDTNHDKAGHKQYEKWIKPTTIQVEAGKSAGDVIRKVLEENQYIDQWLEGRLWAVTSPQGVTLEAGGENGTNSVWCYMIDGQVQKESMDARILQNHDEVLLFFSDDKRKEYHLPAEIKLSLVTGTPFPGQAGGETTILLDAIHVKTEEEQCVETVLVEALKKQGYILYPYEDGEDFYNEYGLRTSDGIDLPENSQGTAGSWKTVVEGGSSVDLRTDKIQDNLHYYIYYGEVENDYYYYWLLIDSIKDYSVRSAAKINWIDYVIGESSTTGSFSNSAKFEKIKKRVAKLDKAAFKVSFQLIGDSRHAVGAHEMYTTWIDPEIYKANEGETAMLLITDVLEDEALLRSDTPMETQKARLPWKGDGENILSITSLDGVRLSNGTNGLNSKWVCMVNGKPLKTSMAEYKLKKDDKIVLYYTDCADKRYPDSDSKIRLNHRDLPLQVNQSVSVKIKSTTLEGDKIISAKSSAPGVVATKINNGKLIITGKKAGSTKITVRTKNRGTDTVKIKVQKKKVLAKRLVPGKKEYTVSRRRTEVLQVKLLPVTARESIEWKSANKKIAAVNQKGVVTGIKRGKTSIIAETPSGVQISIPLEVW